MSNPKQIVLVSATTLEAKLLSDKIFPNVPIVWNREEKFLYMTSPITDDYVVVLVVTGMGLSRAYQGLKQALSMFTHVDCVIGYGLAGGLIKTSKRGDLVVPKTVQTKNSKWIPLLSLKHLITPTTEPWNKLLSVDEIVSSPIDKAGVYAASGMEAVDMESGSWAQACVESNINAWTVVRAVLDGGEDMLPDMSKALNEVGEVIPYKAAIHFLLHPSHISKAMTMTPTKLKEVMSPAIELIQLFLFSKRHEHGHQSHRPAVVSKVV